MLTASSDTIEAMSQRVQIEPGGLGIVLPVNTDMSLASHFETYLARSPYTVTLDQEPGRWVRADLATAIQHT